MIDAEDRNERLGDKKNPKTDLKSNTPVLDNFSRDLIKLAQEGKLDPVIGRENEIIRLAQILSRRKKNNPILNSESVSNDSSKNLSIFYTFAEILSFSKTNSNSRIKCVNENAI